MKRDIRMRKTNPYNIGSIDRTLRYILATILVGAVFYLSPTVMLSIAGSEVMLMKVLTLVGIYPMVTAATGWDPVYHVLGIRSDCPLQADVADDLPTQSRKITEQIGSALS